MIKDKDQPQFIKDGIVRWNNNLLNGLIGLIENGDINGESTVAEVVELLNNNIKELQ